MSDTITIKQLQELERKFETDLIILKNKQMFVKGELQRRLNMNLGKCDHRKVRKGGCFSWKYDYYETWYQCLNCNKIFLEIYTSLEEKKYLEKSTVEVAQNPRIGELKNNYSSGVYNDKVIPVIEKCKHENWTMACYPEMREFNLGFVPFEKVPIFKVSSIYEVYCKDCKNFVNLLTGEIINDKGLVVVNEELLGRRY